MSAPAVERIAGVLAEHLAVENSRNDQRGWRFWLTCEGCDWASEPTKQRAPHFDQHREHLGTLIASLSKARR
jgi:hypothetical protein